ncbi:MAG: sulfite exporter TauE/SafE family protein [Hyphomonadaceae bacterium]|nr:sulfite exporter TauE/SafE family protein [Hyphomonadaceae bacterium]
MLLLALAAAGVFAGFIGGLFGVGGGIVLVPVLYQVWGVLGAPDEYRMHLAVGSSLSTIVATSWRSLSAHAKKGAVDFALLRAWAPWLALGAAAGSAVAGFVDARVLLVVFGAALIPVALNLAFNAKGRPLFAALPTGFGGALVAASNGFLSAMMGVGGGTIGVPIMTLCGRPIHQAVATASGFGAAIAIPATIGFAISGWGRAGLPPLSLGFVNLPAFAIVALLTTFAAPYGARTAHRLDRVALSRAFAVFLAITSLLMLREAIR